MENSFRYIMPDHRLQESMDENIVQKLIYNYLRSWRNHDFHIRRIESKGEKFEARVVSAGEVCIERIYAVDKSSGWVEPVIQLNQG